MAVRMCAKSLQLCPTLCDPRDYSLPGSSVHGVLQARTLKWVAISFCKAHKCSPNNKGTLKKKAPLVLQACGCVSVCMAASRTPPVSLYSSLKGVQWVAQDLFPKRNNANE